MMDGKHVRSVVSENKKKIKSIEEQIEAVFGKIKPALQAAATQVVWQKALNYFNKKTKPLYSEMEKLQREIRFLQAWQCPDFAYHLRVYPEDGDRCRYCDAHLRDPRPD